jgi:glycosyltransferase involved in cell wall biosynthesis
MIRRKIQRLVHIGQELRRRVDLALDVRQLRAECDELRDQIDILKSSLEVPVTLFDEWTEWRARNPVPKEPLVSVCIATYNRARLLTERSIPSVLSQTYRNLELIVVGDGCSDETAELVARIQDPRLRFVNLPEHGSYPADPIRAWMVAGTPAMNHALTLAQGDFVTHLDDDDEYLPERLEKLVAFAIEKECDLVWHPFWIEELETGWRLIDAPAFKIRQVTTASVLYRSWFTRMKWDIQSHRFWEPGDWNRYRKIKYLSPVSMRYPEPLLRHYREHIPR